MPTNQEYRLDQTLIDYLRLATYDPIKYYKLTANLERKYKGWRPKKWLQYKGRQSDAGVFHGMGEQKRRPHFMIQASGETAHRLYTWLVKTQEEILTAFYCTRIDLQRTQLKPEVEYRPKAYNRMRGTKSLITSDTGMTLYIGARTSDTFWRLYDKDDALLRVEIEIKNSLARRSWGALMQGESIAGIWNRFLLRSRVPKFYVDLYQDFGKAAELPEDPQTEDNQPKLEWLQTLDALVYKLLHDHDTHEATYNLIYRWAEYASNVDKKA